MSPRRADWAGDDVALAETALANDVGRNVDVHIAGQITRATQEPIALGKDVEDSLAGLQLGFVDRLLLTAATAASPAALALALALALVTLALVTLALAIAIALLALGLSITVASRAVVLGGRFGLFFGLGEQLRIELLGVEDRTDQL